MLSAAVLFLAACESTDEKDGGRYSLGTTCRILESRGNFTSFIKALDRSGYRRLVDGGGLVTVFAPDDDAFDSYLEGRYGTSDVDQVPVEELTLLVGCHMIQFAYTTEDFLSFSMTSSEDGTDAGDGSCYKYKTYGRAAIEDYTRPGDPAEGEALLPGEVHARLLDPDVRQAGDFRCGGRLPQILSRRELAGGKDTAFMRATPP